MDLRLFHLDHRATRVRELAQLFVERVAQRPGALDRIFVMIVGDRGREQLGQDGAELDRPVGEALRDLPHRGVLQIAAPDRTGDARKHPRFEKVMQDVAARIGDGADIVDRGLGLGGKARHVGERIALPAHAAHFLVVVGVAVGADVEAGGLLRAQVR